MRVDKAELAAQCRKYGTGIQNLPPHVDGPILLWALSGVESSFGQNVATRHEPEFCPQVQPHKYYKPDAQESYVMRGGTYSADKRQVELFKEFGCLACSSYTPWQIMAVNAHGATPLELLSDLDKSAAEVVSMLNRKFSVSRPQSITAVAHIWNGAAASIRYIAQLTDYVVLEFPPNL